MSQPKVSFVMTAFNAGQTISRAIESVLAQTMSDWELVIVDDCSADNTPDVISSYQSDGRLRCLRNAVNQGSGSSRNTAIGAARGDYIAIMDADDESLPHRIETGLDIFERRPELVAVAGQLEEFGTWGGPVRSGWPTSDEAIRQRQLAFRVPIPHPSSIFRREEVVRVGGYDTSCRRAQDYALFLRLMDRPMACGSEVVVRYRTTRPLSLSYVIASTRYAFLAMERNVAGGLRPGPLRSLPRTLPGSFLMDARATIQWSKRRLSERLT